MKARTEAKRRILVGLFTALFLMAMTVVAWADPPENSNAGGNGGNGGQNSSTDPDGDNGSNGNSNSDPDGPNPNTGDGDNGSWCDDNQASEHANNPNAEECPDDTQGTGGEGSGGEGEGEGSGGEGEGEGSGGEGEGEGSGGCTDLPCEDPNESVGGGEGGGTPGDVGGDTDGNQSGGGSTGGGSTGGGSTGGGSTGGGSTGGGSNGSEDQAFDRPTLDFPEPLEDEVLDKTLRNSDGNGGTAPTSLPGTVLPKTVGAGAPGTLPFTGSPTLPYLLIASLLMGLGGALLLIARARVALTS